MTDDSLVLSWVAPEKDGGSKILEYIIEIKETTTTTWTKVGVTAANCTNILVTKLIKDTSYEFRIFARNEAGLSPPLVTEDKIVAGRQISKCNIMSSLSFAYHRSKIKIQSILT